MSERVKSKRVTSVRSATEARDAARRIAEIKFDQETWPAKQRKIKRDAAIKEESNAARAEIDKRFAGAYQASTDEFNAETREEAERRDSAIAEANRAYEQIVSELLGTAK